MDRHICMIAYTTYSTDARVRREAETVASLTPYRVSVLVLKERAEPRTYLLDGVEVKELDIPKYRGKSALQYLLSYVRFLMLAFFECTFSLLKSPPDLIHIHNMPNFLIFAAILPRLSGRKVILDIHDTLIETYSTKFTGVSSRVLRAVLAVEEFICCKLASRIVCVNSMQREALVNRGLPDRKLTVVMNLPDPKKFRSRNGTRPAAGADRFRLVYFGTITNRLGVDLAIRAVAEIGTRVPGLEFHIFGNGEDREDCRRLSAELGLEEIVRFSDGTVPLDDLVEIVRQMDLVVVPNRKNSATELMLPVKMLEGMALGVPVVAPRLKTIEHYFNGTQLFFFDPDDVPSLARAIVGAYEDQTERGRRAENAKQFFEQYAWDTQKMDLIGLYRSLAAHV